jgi:lysophospholipase L1-like esterase
MAEELKVVALGDSTTAGTPNFRSPVEAPPNGQGDEQSQFTYWMEQKHPEWTVLNKGVNGERTDEIFRRIAADVIAEKPHMAIVLAGVNDIYQGRPAGLVTSNLKSIYDKLRRNGIQVLACTILPYNSMSADARNRMKEVNDWIEKYARDYNLGFCDLFHVTENPKKPWTLASTADGLHPDINGHKRMAEALTATIEEWTKADPSAEK